MKAMKATILSQVSWAQYCGSSLSLYVCIDNGSDEGDEGNEGDEGDEGFRHCQGPACPRCRLRWQQGENSHGPKEVGLDEEQDRENCQPQVPCCGQEGLCQHQVVDYGLAESTQGARCEGLCRSEKGLPNLQSSEGTLHCLSF